MTLSYTDAVQSFISHFKPRVPVDQPFPLEFDKRLTIDSKNLDARLVIIIILETEFHENNNVFAFHQNRRQCNWKIVSTIITICAVT